MLIYFKVGNFLSFKDIKTLDLRASSITEFRNNVSLVAKKKLLKTAAIYGANASGKSNLLYAVNFVKRFLLFSFRDSSLENEIGVNPFLLNSATEKKPSYFEFCFIVDDIQYRYGLEVTRKMVIAEWLFETKKTKENLLFIRNKEDIEITNLFKEGEGLEKKTRSDKLFLTVVAQFNGKISKNIMKWFDKVKIITGFSDEPYKSVTVDILSANDKDNTIKKLTLRWLKDADLSIQNFNFSEMEEKFELDPSVFRENYIKKLKNEILKQKKHEVQTVHNKYNSSKKIIGNVSFNLDDESEGTRKLFYLIGPLMDTIARGYILFIDELEAKLHPIITQNIIRLFNTAANKHAQLIFATHDTNLLSSKIFRRDQIWFTEKNKTEETDLYSLVEYKVPKIRKDESFEKNYIRGRYGAIPFVGNSNNILSGLHGKKSKN